MHKDDRHRAVQSLLDKALVSVVIPASNEYSTLGHVIREAQKISKRTEIIAVCNGCVDRSEQVAQAEGAKVLAIKETLGYDVGRAIGAKHAKGDVILFIDGDFVLPAAKLRAFCLEVIKGNDVVLNGYNGYRSKKRIHSTSQAKRLLNRCLGRADLGGSSLTAVPHALSRRALETIGYTLLSVPPKALSKAVLSGLTVKKFRKINVAKHNKRKNRKRKHRRRLKQLIIGDHAEALAYVMQTKGVRSGFQDGNRLREWAAPTWSRKYMQMVQQISDCLVKPKPPTNPPGDAIQSCSVIISAFNEEATLGPLLKQVQALQPLEIIVVENGSSDRTRSICTEHEVKGIFFNQRLGHDVGRAIGAREAAGDILLFLDGDIVFTAEELKPFILACSEADLVLNNIRPYLKSSAMIDYVSMAKAFLNRTLAMSRLKYSSLTAVPHAMTKEAVAKIGYEHLAVPPKAQAIAALSGLKIEHIQGPNVLQRNKQKANNIHTGNEVEALILGDHLEALAWAQSVLGPRLKLVDDLRRRDKLAEGVETIHECIQLESDNSKGRDIWCENV